MIENVFFVIGFLTSITYCEHCLIAHANNTKLHATILVEESLILWLRFCSIYEYFLVCFEMTNQCMLLQHCDIAIKLCVSF